MMSLINQIAQTWCYWMGSMLWQVSILILIITIIDMLIRKWMWPQVRYALWLLIIVKLMIPPTWSLPTGIIPQIFPKTQERIAHQWNKQFSALEKRNLSNQTAIKIDFSLSKAADLSMDKSSINTSIEKSSQNQIIRPIMHVYIMGAWILGMALFVTLLFIRIKKLRRWHQDQKEKKTIPVWFHKLLLHTAQRLKLERLPAIVFSDEAVTPAVYGIFRPVLLLPESYFDSLSHEEAEHVLLHELAHLKRGDLWVHGIYLLLHIVYWFNPLMIWVGKQLNHLCELCCDLTIANLLKEKTVHYRKTLLNTARTLLTESVKPAMGLLGVFEEPFQLMTRLRWLEKVTWRNRKQIIATVCCLSLTMIIFIFPMAGVKQKAEDIAPNAIKINNPVTDEEKQYPAESLLKQEPGDLYIKEVYRTDSYFLWKLLKSEVTSLTETWIGDQKLAYLETSNSFNRKVILNLKKNLIFFINNRTRSYVEAPLPLDNSMILSEEIKWRHLKNMTSGKVKKTNRTKMILNKKCDEYNVTFWRVQGVSKLENQTFKVWATIDVPFNLNIYYEFLINLRKIGNRDEKLRNELEKIKGIQMGLESKFSRLFASKRYITEVVELSRKIPPEDTYLIPDDYTKKEKLESEDF